MQTTDTILSSRWVIPIKPANTVLENHSVVINNGKIIDCLPQDKALKKYPNAEQQHYANHVLMPGLINAHTHSAMNLFKGLADDLPLQQWLEQHIWPAEGKWLSPRFIREGSELAIAEMLLSGTTCFNDMYLFPNETATVAQHIGIRAVIGLTIIGFASAWANNDEQYFEKAIMVHDQIRNMSLVTSAMAPHAPYTVSDQALQKCQLLADELDIPIHMHIHETAHEVEQAQKDNGLRPLARLEQLGLLTPRLLAVHMTQLNNSEIELISAQGVNIIHCPKSNLKLNSGYCPVNQLIKNKVNVCIGTDSSASNNTLDMLNELQFTALIGKAVANDASAINAHQALQMATINAARALNMDDIIGSIESGKAADLIAIDLNQVNTQPVYDAASQIAYCANSRQVSDVWVNGKQLVKNRQLTTIDKDLVLNQANNWANKINTTGDNRV